MENKELLFYKQPFHIAKYISWVYDAKNNFVFQFENEFDEKDEYKVGIKELQKKIIESLNSEEHSPIPTLNLKKDSSIRVYNNEELFITIRGWGNLTGVGAHNLPSSEAVKIQDNFRDWLIYKLSTSNKTE